MNISQKVYLVKAIYDWCIDNSYIPYVTVLVDKNTQVPMRYVIDDKIILNVSPDAVSNLLFLKESIQCSACFGGKKFDIFLPVDNVIAIYSKENGEGLTFTPLVKKNNEQIDLLAREKNTYKASHSLKPDFKSNVMSRTNTKALKTHLKLIK